VSSSAFVPFRISVCGVEELAGHCEAGVSHVLSILDPGNPPPPAFGSFGEHVRLDLRFEDIIEAAPDRLPPEEEHVRAVLAFGQELIAESAADDAHLLVHCYAGVSRSTASMALILTQARRDRPAAEALAEVARIRPQAWPNLRMLELGDAMLGLRGSLVEAAAGHYQRAYRRNPEVAEFMSSVGRHRELALAGHK
jgi:predicted protein tyrosine phosphatase